jgi:hypothetical protein
MRRWIALFLIVLLPLRGLAGDLMAMALIGPATGPATIATIAAPCHDGLPTHMMAHPPRAGSLGASHEASPSTLHGTSHGTSYDTSHGRSKGVSHAIAHGIAHDSSHGTAHDAARDWRTPSGAATTSASTDADATAPAHGAACSACQLCHSAVLAVPEIATALSTAPLAMPVFEPVSSASHVPPHGLKPPIS